MFLTCHDPTIPLLFETDGAYSSNPGPADWGAILAQGMECAMLHGEKADTTSKEAMIIHLLGQPHTGWLAASETSPGWARTGRGRKVSCNVARAP
jgi:hypothetical protein